MDSDDELVEVEVAVSGGGGGGIDSLPYAESMINDDDNDGGRPMEVEVLVDFGVTRTPSSALYVSNHAKKSTATIASSLATAIIPITTNEASKTKHHEDDDDDDHREDLAYANEKNLPETAEEKQVVQYRL